LAGEDEVGQRAQPEDFERDALGVGPAGLRREVRRGALVDVLGEQAGIGDWP
jgi:hypothetical protein